MKNSYLKSWEKAFTLVELMIMVGIIALLALLAIPNLLRARISASDAIAQSTLKSIAVALEDYMMLNNQYPGSTNSLLGISPPYLNKDYFSGTHMGYTYTADIASYSYTIVAAPFIVGQTGTTTYTMTTGGVLQEE